MELLLLGCFALVQSRVNASAGIHQAAVAVVLVRFDSADVEFAAGSIITVLHQRTIIILRQKHITVCVCAVNLCTYLR